MDIEIKSQPFVHDELKKIKKDLHSGRIRRFGAIVDHQKLKFSYNALVAWKRESVGRGLSQKLKAKDITEYESNPGPGSFTGLKIGTTIANVFNWALGKKKINELALPEYGREPNITPRKK